MAALTLRRGTILCYRIYDIADEVDLAALERLLTQSTSRLKLTRQRSEYLHVPNPPLTVELGIRTLELVSGSRNAEASARIFDHGAISVLFRVPIAAGTELDALLPLVSELQEAQGIDEAGLDVVRSLKSALKPATKGDHLWDQDESYTIVFVEELSEDVTDDELVSRVDIARLVLGETEQLSPSERDEVLSQRYSYSRRDLAVIDWNGAFVYEPSGSFDIPDVLEIANAQLLGLRYYDEQLDERSSRIYDEMQARRRWFGLFFSPYRKLARRVLVTLLELSEFVERVENSLKIIGDTYVAKVYEGALTQLRVPRWQASVTRKLDIVSKIYQLLKDELDTDRALALEVLIVALIVMELALAALIYR